LKQAYISVVLIGEKQFSESELIELDQRLFSQVKQHELLALTNETEEEIASTYREVQLNGPVTFLSVFKNTNFHLKNLNILARSVGDFVIVWNESPKNLTREIIAEFLAYSDSGYEIVHLRGREKFITRSFYGTLNIFRNSGEKVISQVGTLFSRRVVSTLLSSKIIVDHIDLAIADTNASRVIFTSKSVSRNKPPFRDRLNNAILLITRGTRIGAQAPLLLSLIFTTLALSVCIYAGLVFLVKGETPEGWATLMIFVGFGQSAVLTILGLIWARLDSLTASFQNSRDVTNKTLVFPPTLRQSSKG
jgi:hypothetical protein